MTNFNEAWLEIVVANPVIALDAFFSPNASAIST